MIDPNRGPSQVPNFGTMYSQTAPPDSMPYDHDPVSPMTPIQQGSSSGRPSLTLDTSFNSSSSSREASPPPYYDGGSNNASGYRPNLPSLEQKRALQPTPVEPEPLKMIHPAERESPPLAPMGIPDRHPQHTLGALFPRHASAIPLHHLNMAAAIVDCPVCRNRSVTRTKKQIGNTQHAWAIGATALTGVLGFVPYLMKTLKDVEHYCSSCGAHLVNWHKSGTVEVLAHA